MLPGSGNYANTTVSLTLRYNIALPSRFTCGLDLGFITTAQIDSTVKICKPLLAIPNNNLSYRAILPRKCYDGSVSLLC
jgi:hypothetical protein